MTTNQRDHAPKHKTHEASQLFAGGGETGALMQAMNWAETPLGPVESWPQSLQTAVSICLASRFPMLLWWGPDLIMLYNDAYRPMLGTTKHPQALGHPGRDCWSEIWDIIGPMLEGVVRTGIATWSDDQFLPLKRYGYSEECYFTFSYSPIRDETGGVGGVFSAITETTSRVLSERRSRTARELAAALVTTHTGDEVLQQAAHVFADNPHDLPFTLLYRLESPAPLAHLVATSGLAAGTPLSPHHLSLTDPEACWPIRQVSESLQAGLVTDLAPRWDCISVQARPHLTPHRALVLPLIEPGQTRPTALMVTGISPRLALDDAYRAFTDLLAGHMATALASVHAYEAERRRAETLAELDRAKTTFFSNVSHEFRTPLTLMLGPLEDLVGAEDLRPDQHDHLHMIHRNGLRLLKLVNTLLDFSRIEAGRAQAVYVPTDLAALTSDLASVFRSLIEQAGLHLAVECPPLSEPVSVDREMWEKIVLNLLSNAFKFTFAGEITVALRQVEQQVELVVRDTGTGVACEEVPRLFERFHRVQGARSRTHEGSGIGLALVQDLVHLHGGTIAVDSQLDVGTTFTVRLPLGTAHLPADRIQVSYNRALTALGAAPFVEEARRWLPAAASGEQGEADWRLTELGRSQVPVASVEEASPLHTRILVADDNADLRDFLSRLLAQHYDVETVANGAAALQAARRCPPDLVLADVMMPELDGFELLDAFHADPELEALPVILLSARAGEEATLEGLAAGANDYLVKPFSSREVLARIATHLEIARLRREADARAHELAVILDTMDDAVVVIGPGGKIARTNPAYFRLLQIEHSTEWQAVFLRVTLAERKALMRIADLTGHPLPVEEWTATRLLRGETFTGSQAQVYRITGMAGQQRVLSVSGVPLYDAQGQVQGGVEVLHDLTARYEQEQERAQMLNVVAHELRSPLTSLKMGTELTRRRVARGTPVEPDQLQRNAQAVERMERLVNDLLTAAQAETAQVVLQRAPTDLTALCKQVATEQMGPSGRTIDLEVPEEPVVAEVDRGRIGQVVENLLSNALKYSPTEATVTLQLRREARNALITVQDSGPGIPADVQPRLFERFYRAPGAKVLHGTGVGLGVGLYLCKQLVERHGGTISVASEVGHGTSFTVRLPLAG